MTKLNDTHCVLLAAAAQRGDASLLPLPASLKASARISKAIAQLMGYGLAEERETSDTASVHRTGGDHRFGVYATAAGLAAVGVGDEAGAAVPAVPLGPDKTSKKDAVVTLLGRDDGATLPELIDVTGWLPHTTRAALTGLRKAGHVIDRGKRDGATCYRIVAAAR